MPEEPKTDVKVLLEEGVKKVKAMTKEERKRMTEAQRRSWVIGELMLDDPDLSREEAERLYDEAGD